jgi:antitoxin PrlF
MDEELLQQPPPAGPGAGVHYHGNIIAMATHSKLTAQGQISVPARIRRKLGLGPGSVLEWDDDGEEVVVRRVGRYSSGEVHRALFPTSPKPRTLSEIKEGVRRDIKRRRAIR